MDRLTAAVSPEAEFEVRKALFEKGTALIREWGVDAHTDEYRWDAFLDQHSDNDVHAYAFAVDHQQRSAVSEKRVSIERNVAPILTDMSQVQQRERRSDVVAHNSRLDDQLAQLAAQEFANTKLGLQDIDQATAHKYLAQVSLFLKIIGDGKDEPLLLSQISASEMRYYVDLLPRLPPRLRLKDNRSIKEIMASAKGTIDPPPLDWSDSKYGFFLEEDGYGEEKLQA